MNSIRAFIDNMFFGLKETPELIRAKEELQTMMEDKYLELKHSGKSDNEALGQVISEFGNLEELADDLGIAEEIKVKPSPKENESSEAPDTGIHIMSNEEANQYIADYHKYSKYLAAGIFIMIISPILLVVTSGYFEQMVPNAKDIYVLPGLIYLFLCIIAGVTLTTICGIRLSKWNKLDQKLITLPYPFAKQIQEKRDRKTESYSFKIASSIALFLIGIIILLIFTFVYEDNEFYASIGVGIFFLCIGAGVAALILFGMRRSIYNRLLNLEEYSTQGMKEAKKTNAIVVPFWLMTIAVYLLWSFLGTAWGVSWIVWPVAALLFAALHHFLKNRA